jgi:hypothetical protein
MKMIYKTRPDLGDLRPAHLIALAVLCAASNTIVLNLYLAIVGHLTEPLTQIATVLVGDVIGTIIVLYLTSFILRFFMSRRRA